MISPKENLIRAIRHNNPEYVPYYGWGSSYCEDYFVYLTPRYERYREKWEQDSIDYLGIKWQKSCTGIGYPIEYPIKSIDDVLNYQFPDPNESGILDLKEEIKEIKKEKFALGDYNRGTIYDMATLLIGTENNLLFMIDEPEAMIDFFGRVYDYNLQIAKQYIEAGVDMVKLCDDYGAQTSLQMSPAIWRKFIKPYLAKLVKVFKENGVIVMLHSCGRIMEIFEDVVKIGVDIWDPSQSRANNLVELKEKYGDKITFSGAVDTQDILIRGNEKEIIEAVKEKIRTLAIGGGYICSPEQPMPIPEKNYYIFAEAVKKYGRYPIKI